MRFPALIFKNLFRRKTRSSLAILGISIGIATIIALGAVANGFRFSTERMLRTGKADFCVTERGVADLAFSKVDEEKLGEIERMAGVKKATGITISIHPVDDIPIFVVFGVRSEDLPIVGVEIIEGEAFAEESEDEIILGRVASKEMNKGIGDELGLGEREFQVTGIFETGSPFHDRGATLSLKVFQKMQRLEGQVMMIYVELERGADIEKICQQIEDNHPDLVTIKSVAEFSKVDKGLEAVDAAAWIVSLLAIIIGGIGVMNTMTMAVFERTREIGILRALGWKRRRILSMILGESILLCLLAVLFGSLVGVLGVKLLTLHPMVKGFLEPIYTLDVFTRALFMALLVGLVGGLYPAYRASKLSPSEAIRYE
ncbi:MAG: ABC transporter permease [Candidatus Bathyarchaeia archaeon]